MSSWFFPTDQSNPGAFDTDFKRLEMAPGDRPDEGGDISAENPDSKADSVQQYQIATKQEKTTEYHDTRVEDPLFGKIKVADCAFEKNIQHSELIVNSAEASESEQISAENQSVQVELESLLDILDALAQLPEADPNSPLIAQFLEQWEQLSAPAVEAFLARWESDPKVSEHFWAVVTEWSPEDQYALFSAQPEITRQILIRTEQDQVLIDYHGIQRLGEILHWAELFGPEVTFIEVDGVLGKRAVYQGEIVYLSAEGAVLPPPTEGENMAVIAEPTPEEKEPLDALASPNPEAEKNYHQSQLRHTQSLKIETPAPPNETEKAA